MFWATKEDLDPLQLPHSAYIELFLYFDPLLVNILQMIPPNLYLLNLAHFNHVNLFDIYEYGHAKLTNETKCM